MVATTICSWIAISNHCAFAAVALRMDKAAIACPFHSKPAKQNEQSPQVECCKVLRALILAKTRNWVRDDTQFRDANFPVELRFFLVLSPATMSPLLLDTGPPGASSFAELILQRSLLAHAPPLRG